MERGRVILSGYPTPGNRYVTKQQLGRQGSRFPSGSRDIYATEVQTVPLPAVPDIRVLVKNNTSQKLQYKIEGGYFSTGPTWPGEIAPWESKILDLRYLKRAEEYQFLTLGFNKKPIEVYKPSGKKREVTILISEKVVFDISFFNGFVS